jgi:hypothetical protein
VVGSMRIDAQALSAMGTCTRALTITGLDAPALPVHLTDRLPLVVILPDVKFLMLAADWMLRQTPVGLFCAAMSNVPSVGDVSAGMTRRLLEELV